MKNKSVNIINEQSGEISSIPDSQVSDAIKQGYRLAAPSEVSAHFEKEEFTGGAKPLLAGLAGAGRALTFGGSDIALTKSGLVKPETLKKLEEYNPVESLAGEGAAIAGSLLIPGYGEATTASAAARAATLPVRAATKLGQTVTKGVAGALPEATGLAGRSAVAALSHGAGGAVEGALYGAGRAVTEHGMGDPSLDGESLMSHVGISALLGGGLSSAVGLAGVGINSAKQGISKLMPEKPLPEAGPAIIDSKAGKEAVSLAPEGTLERAAQDMGVDPTKRAELENGSKNLKPNARQIIEESQIAGLSPMEGQISSDKRVQHFQTMLLDSPTTTGAKQREAFEANWNKAGQNFGDALETGEARSAHEAGIVAKDVLKEQIDTAYRPIQESYKKLGPDADSILVPEKRVMQAMGDLLEKADTPSPNSAVGGPRKKLFEQWAERLQDQRTLGNFDGIYTEVSNAERAAWRSGNYTEAHVLSEIKGSIKEFQENIIDEAHMSLAKASGVAKEEMAAYAKELKAERSFAKKKYAKFVETIGDLAGAVKLGKAKTYREIMEALEKIEPSKLAENAFRGDRVKALTKLQKEFPAAFDLLSNQYKKELLESVFKDGAVNPKAAAKKISDIPKEIKAMLFDPDQIKKMDATKTWLEALPQDWAPSKTPRGMMYMEYFSSPLKAIGAEVMAAAQTAYVKSSVDEMSAIMQLQRAAKKNLNKISSGAKAIFDVSKDRATAYAAGKIAEEIISHEEPQKVIRTIREVANNPELMIDKLSRGTESIEGIAPQMATSLQASAARAVQYLAAVAPDTESQYPLGDKPEPSRRELNIFSERLHVIKNPTSILKEIKAGTLTPEHVEIVSTIYPKMYQQMQQAVMEQMVNAVSKKKAISYKTKNMLSLFLNQDLDAGITAQAIMQNQMAIQRSHMQDQAQQQQAAGNVKPTQKGLGELDSSKQMMMPMQKSSLRMS